MKQRLIFSSVLALAALNMSIAANAAPRIDSYEDYRLYCSPLAFRHQVQSSDCDSYRNLYEQRLQQELEQRQIRRRSIRRQKRSSERANNNKFYLGASLGLGFPTNDVELLNEDISDADVDTAVNNLGLELSTEEARDLVTVDLDLGFSGSLFFGTKFNRNFGLDLELTGSANNVDLVADETDVTYSQGGLFLNPRFEFPLSKQDRSLSVFVSPGIGVTQGRLTIDIPNETAEFLGINEDQSLSLEDKIGFAWQAKAGLAIPFGDRYSGFTQLRYMNSTGDTTADLFATEVGMMLQF